MKMNSDDQKELPFEVGENETATDVTVEDPPQQGGQVSASEQPSTKDELDSVSENVQKRIAKLTAKMREAERREQAALEYAKGMQNQAQTLQQQLLHTDYGRLNEARTRLQTQQATLKAIIKKAREENDIDTETEAQERLTALLMEQQNVNSWMNAQQARIQQPQPVQQPVQQVQQRPQKPQPSPKAESWAAKNQWFGQDPEMTYAAWGIHQTLIEREGFDPNSDEYYTELDNRIRKRFSDRLPAEAQQPNNRQQRSAPSAVAPASRSSGVNSARRTVRLTPSQIAIAKKLGVPIEEYAKYVKD